jgi:AAA15 family ATPase/GTPase
MDMATPAHLAGLSVSNFLSIHNLDVELPRGLVAFVGRNGSGKSNILNAIQFVLNCSSSGLGVERLADLQCNDVDKVRRSAGCYGLIFCGHT